MLRKAKALKGYTLNSLNGEIGEVKEFYFDDQHWTVRYLVADTGTWLEGRQVLISPYALVAVNKEKQHIEINLTKKQIEDSPPLESDKPVSRQFEDAYYGFYGWPMYWGGPYLWGAYPFILHDAENLEDFNQSESAWDPYLRSTDDVTGNHIQAADGEIGHVADFIIDDETWAIRYVVVDTRNWLQGKKILISPQWIERVSWLESKVFVNLSKEAIEQAPEYTETSLLSRDYEASLHVHYHRQGYWVDDSTDRQEKYVEKLSAELLEWEVHIDRLKEKVESATPERTFGYAKAIAVLQLKRDEAAVKLQDISAASDHEWEDLKSGTEQIRSEVSNLLRDTTMKI